jgi:hypothetical protein
MSGNEHCCGPVSRTFQSTEQLSDLLYKREREYIVLMQEVKTFENIVSPQVKLFLPARVDAK